MGILSRMLRLCKADVHGVMDQLEDKELLLKQYLREMEVSLGQKEQQVSALTQHIGRSTGQINRHVEEMGKLERDLALALKKEKDDIARMLIRRRRALETASSHLKEQIEMMTQEQAQLAETLSHQQLRYETLKVKADACCRRTGDGLFDTQPHLREKMVSSFDPSDAEIELELLERKEALAKGGTH